MNRGKRILVLTMLAVYLAMPVQGVTTGSWDFEAGKHHAQDTIQKELTQEEPEAFWAWLRTQMAPLLKWFQMEEGNEKEK